MVRPCHSLMTYTTDREIDKADPYHCDKLLHRGQWLDSPDRKPERRAFQNWQVPGCLLHEYTTPEIADCNEDGQVLFVGDTTVRQIFWATAKKLDNNWANDRQQERHKHEDLQLQVNNARLKFIWDPWLNSTAFGAELQTYIERNKIGISAEEKKTHASNGKQRSVLIFVGGGLWHARHLGEDYLSTFHNVVDRVAAVMSSTHARLTTPADAQAHGSNKVDDQIFFAPLLSPIIDRLSPSREGTITQHKVGAMNDHLQMWSNRGLKVPWVYRDMTETWPGTVGESGLHVIDHVATQMADVVLNYRCNAKVTQKNGYPFNRTCCSAYRSSNWVQVIISLASVLLAGLWTFNSFLQSTNQRSMMFALTDTLVVFVLVAAYCFIADRTHVFDKIPKEFANIEFRVMLGLAVVLCLLNIQSAPSSSVKSRQNLTEKKTRSTTFLTREQSDEFKGWLQIYVLVYAYTGASNVLDFYKVFRIFVALYLMLSGYGHTTYFLRTGDFTAQRIVGVLLRINTLPMFLALALDRPYTSYYFATLITFWFLVVALTLRIGQKWNNRLLLVILKVGIMALITTWFTNGHNVLERFASVVNMLFRARLDVNAMRFHLSMDGYVVYVGVITAAIRLETRAKLRTPFSQLGFGGWVVKTYLAVHQFLLAALAAVALPVFWILTQRSRDKEDYNWWMPSCAWIPALSLVVLRNATAFLRARYCAPFAWLGRMSLELYILSQHIWLAGDGEDILRIGFRYGSGTFLGDKWRDLMILTPLLLWFAWKVHDGTRVTTAWIVHGQITSTDLEQSELPMNEAAIELSGWHQPEEDIEDQRRNQQSARNKLLLRAGGIASAIWLINVVGC